jgi:DNA-binding LacI/PurR family transcriptional regulator
VEHGISARFEHGEDTEIGGYEATMRLLSRRELPTAIGVGNLGQLFGTLKALREAGADVPRDVSLISFDEDACLEFLEVPITSVSMPLLRLGAAAVLALVDRINGLPGTDVMVNDPLVLLERSSTARPRLSRRIGA